MAEGDEDFAQDEEEEIEGDADDTTKAVAESDADADDEDDEAVPAPAGRTRKPEQVEVHSTAARAALRDTIAADVEAFLARGGSIKRVGDDERAEPAKKSEGSYGRGSV